MLFNRIFPFEEIEVGKKYYLYHRDSSKPEPNVNSYIEVLLKDKEKVVLKKASNDYFIDNDKNYYDYLVFKKYFYSKDWYLSY